MNRNSRIPSRKIWVCECAICVTIVHKFSQEAAQEFIREHNKHANSQMKIDYEIMYSGNG